MACGSARSEKGAPLSGTIIWQMGIGVKRLLFGVSWYRSSGAVCDRPDAIS
jgi:hypothetical protein